METIFALSSGRPPAAIGVIRISGPAAHAAGAALCGRLPRPREAALRALRAPSGEVLDQAVVLRFDSPASSTGEDAVELHCHGGRATIEAILHALAEQPGCRPALPGEFTRRAFANGRIDLTEVEGLADLLEAETEAQRRSALSTAGGSVRRQVEEWRDRIVMLSARAEAAIDYVGDEDEVGGGEADFAADAAALVSEMDEWLGQPLVEPLRSGIRVVFAGPPNAGKSSLLNALVGEDKAIVAPEPGTTRDVIEVPVGIEGVPFVFVDTAGLRDADDAVERIGVARAAEQVSAADLICWLGDPLAPPVHPRVISVAAKSDIHGAFDRLGVPVSSRTGAGLASLKLEMLRLAQSLLPHDDAKALNRRQAEALTSARDALMDAGSADLVIAAEALRLARSALDRLTGRAGVDDVLDALFGRFCLGK